MNRRRHAGRRWCLRILKIAAGSATLLLLGFLLLQLVLSTSWMRGKVAAGMSQRMGGLEVVISDLSWTPWNGAALRGLEVRQPEALWERVPTPLLGIEEVHAWPDYGAALKGQWTASEMTIVRPRLHLAAEMLASIAASGMPAAEPPPAIAAVVPVPAPLIPPTSDAVPAANGPVEKPAAATTPAQVPASAPQPKVTRKRLRVVVEEGSFELVRAGERDRLIEIDGVNLDLPLFGEAGESASSVASIACMGQSLAKDLKIRAKTEGTGVELSLSGDPRKEFGVFGNCSMGLVSGLPIQADLLVRIPKVERVTLSKMLSGQAGETQARIQGGGWLQAPSSWRGVSAFEASEPLAWIAGQAVDFDSGSAVVQLADGVIQSPDFRVIGDSASILGNGWVTARDGAAVVRVVVPYPIVGIMNGELSKRIPESVFAFRPLNPDNRWYSDVSLWRGVAGWSVGFGERGSVMMLDEVLAAE